MSNGNADHTFEIVDNPEKSEFDLLVDGQQAGLMAYQRSSTQLALVHTEVADEFQGRGLGTAFVKAILDGAASSGVVVLPYCPLVNAYVKANPEYFKLVPEGRWAEFGLA